MQQILCGLKAPYELRGVAGGAAACRMRQRLLCALAALFSLFTLNLVPAWAQNPATQAFAPGMAPQDTNRHDGADTAVFPMSTAPAAGTNSPVVVPPGQTVQSVDVHGRTLVLEGTVAQDVTAIDSDVTIKPGARVGGYLLAFGGTVDNQAGDSVRVREMSRDSLNTKNWFGGQLFMLMMGLLGGLVLLFAFPQATLQAVGTLASRPTRSLVVGGLSALALLIALSVSNAIMATPLHRLWIPVHAALVIATLLAVAGGWLCGARFAGGLLARKLGRPESGGLYGRLALGLTAFFLVNVVLGGLNGHLVGIAMLAELVFVLMGLGALVTTLSSREKTPTSFGRLSDNLTR